MQLQKLILILVLYTILWKPRPEKSLILVIEMKQII